ncbi:MAG: alkaline phosphatase family protein [Oscillospiraceae bacterium]|nr:alkaline phosphatase family protein [Oscillospiraceae bacterium]
MLCYPDYNRSVLSIISSIMKYYRAPYEYSTLPALDKQLGKFYKNVILVVLDGMGTDMLERNLSGGDFLRKNFVQNITSVFPSTTAAAMTSYYTGVSPGEHGWLGWSLFFKEFCRSIDVYSNLDSYTKQPVGLISNAAEFVMPYETIYKDIAKSVIGDVQPFTISQSKVRIAENGNIHKTADSFERVCELIGKICATEQNTFTYVQWCSPDDTAHRTGCYSDETRNKLKEISGMLGKTMDSLTDTLMIISSDHGMIDISDEILIDRIPELNECLAMPPFIESRAMSFFVKSDRRTDFERSFANLVGHDFMLFPRREVFARNLLGTGNFHSKTYDFIGDYLACAVSDVGLRYRTLNAKPKNMNKANHGGLTEQEMTIPLIIADSPQTKEYKQKKLL